MRNIRLNHMIHRLCRPPSIPLSFNPVMSRTTRAEYFHFNYTENILILPRILMKSGRGLIQGYLIPIDTHAFAFKRQLSLKMPFSTPEPLVQYSFRYGFNPFRTKGARTRSIIRSKNY